MRITWLFEATDQIWGGVKVALEDANWLHDRGHTVTVLSRTAPPGWMPLRAPFRQVPDFRPAHVPESDVVIGTYWSTVVAAIQARRGAVVHFCQGYEGDHSHLAAHRDAIAATYRSREATRITIARHLTERLRQQFGDDPLEIVYVVDHEVMTPGPLRQGSRPVRVGLVGPYQVAWKDLATGLQACQLAHRAGLDIQLVRITNTAPHPDELSLPLPVEWHRQVVPAEMGAIYRSLDVFLATSRGTEEGFFLPAVEAMACGVPCVLTDIACFRGHGDGDYALFVPPSDPVAMAEALVVLAGVPTLRATLRQNGIRAAARYRRDAHGRQLEQALQLALTRQQRAAGQTDPTALHELAEQRQRAGDPAGALAVTERMLALPGDAAAVHRLRGHLLYAQGRATDAAQAFRAAIAAGTASAALHNDLGVVLHRCGDPDGARHSFQRALLLEPDHADARANLHDLSLQSAAGTGLTSGAAR